MSERHTFASAHPQSSSHIIIKRTTPVVPVLLGPQIPRRDREETHERYCRALLTLFVPWRSVSDICALNETWSQAWEVRKSLISSNSLKVIENIQLLHECKHDRDEHLRQVLLEAQNESNIDPILISNCHEENQNIDEDDPEQLLQMLSIVSETTINAYSASIGNQEKRYLNEALLAIDSTDRFALLNGEFINAPFRNIFIFYLDQHNTLNQNGNHILHDFNTFIVAQSQHARMIKEWKREIEIRREKARNYLISGEDTLEIRDDETQIEVVTTEIPTSPLKMQTIVVPPVITTKTVSFPSKTDVVKKYTLNNQQKYAFMIITGHLDGDNKIHTGLYFLDFVISRLQLIVIP